MAEKEINCKMILNLKIIKKNAKIFLAFFLDLIFPIECIICFREGDWICGQCFNKISYRYKQSCFGCKKENEFGEFCSKCKNLYSIDGILIASNYDDKIISELIKKFKYNFIKDIYLILANFLYIFTFNFLNKKVKYKSNIYGRKRIIPEIFLNFEKALVIPSPLHKKRLKWRGFNQSEKIAVELARKLNLAINSNNLIKIKNNKPQAKLNEIDRKLNIIGNFSWQGEKLDNKNIILIDDVATTGSTLNECAKVLKNNGAGNVWGVVIAKG